MHGSSSVPKELIDIINEYGGEIRPTWGVPVEEIQLGIRHGVRKINVDTDSRLAITGAIRKAMVEDPGEFDPRSYLKPARAAMQKVIAQRMTQFGQAGHAGDYEARSLADMRDFYAGAAASVSVTKVIEVIGSSPTSSDDAVREAVASAAKSIRGISNVDVVERDVRRRAGRHHALERARQDLVPRRAALDP